LAAAAGGVEADDGEIEMLERSLLAREMAAGLDRSTEPGVQTFNRVCIRYDICDVSARCPLEF
jgi:hypothetical protein